MLSLGAKFCVFQMGTGSVISAKPKLIIQLNLYNLCYMTYSYMQSLYKLLIYKPNKLYKLFGGGHSLNPPSP